jgi:ATP synthase protein I
MLKDLKEFLHDFFKLTAMATQIGLALVFAIFIGFGIGYYLDKWLKVTHPWLKIIFLVFGIIAGFRNVYIIMKRIQREEKKRGF